MCRYTRLLLVSLSGLLTLSASIEQDAIAQTDASAVSCGSGTPTPLEQTATFKAYLRAEIERLDPGGDAVHWSSLCERYHDLLSTKPERALTPLAPAAQLQLLTPVATDAEAPGSVSFEASLLEGVTEFLLDRAKADLAAAALEDLGVLLWRSPLLRELFPATQQVADHAYQVNPKLYLAMVRDAAVDDFGQMPLRLARRMDDPKTPAMVPARLLLEDLEAIRRGGDPLRVLAEYREQAHRSELRDRLPRDAQKALRVAGKVAHELHYGRFTLNSGERLTFVAALRDARYQAYAIHYFMENLKPDVVAPEAVLDLAERMEEVRRLRQEMMRRQQDLATDVAHRGPRAWAGVLRALVEASRTAYRTAGVPDPAMEAMLDRMNHLVAIAEAVALRDYPSAVQRAATMLNVQLGWFERDLIALLADPGNRLENLEEYFREIARTELVEVYLAEWCGSDTLDQCVALRKREVLDVAEARVRAAVESWRFLEPLALIEVDAVRLKHRIDAAIAQTFLVLKSRQSTTWTDVKQALKDLASSVSGAVRFELTQPAVLDAARARLQQAIDARVNDRVLQLAAAVASLAASQSAEEVYNTLLAAVDPPGTYRAKRGRNPGRRNVVFALQAHVGATGAWEAQSGAGGSGLAGGATIPVGLSLTTGRQLRRAATKGEFSKIGHYSGLFISVADLGTYANFYGFAGEAEDEPPAYSYAQIWAPGVHAVFSFTPRLPLTFGFGARWIPQMRSIDGEAVRSRQIGAFVAVDIPLFILNRSR